MTADAVECNKNGIDAFFPILREVCTLDKAMEKGYAIEIDIHITKEAPNYSVDE